MPRGMVLKSEGFASTLYDPGSELTLAAYCAEHGEPYADIGLPVKLETFVSYGIAFQQRFVPGLEDRQVVTVERLSDRFELRLDDGETVAARRVVVASGIQRYAFTPPELSGLAAPLLTHSAVHRDLDGFAGRQVLVIGAGASAMDLAALLHQQGANVTVVARRPRINWCGAPRPRTLLDELRGPMSGVGTGWRSLACCKAPMVFHHMPESFRLPVVQKHLGPAPGWAVRQYVEKHVPLVVGNAIGARADEGRAVLTLRRPDGGTNDLMADHVIAATGYRVDMRRLEFLGERVQAALKCADHTPVLSGQFESSVPGLYFTGASAANSFGPLLRFAYGAGFATRRLTRHLARGALRRSMMAGRSPVATRPESEVLARS